MTLNKNRKAMTLIELVISMTILAAIVAIAVISVDDMGETSRYDETDRRGKLIQNAVVGYDTPRFLEDMGRLPVTLVDLDSNTYGSDDDSILERKKYLLAELIDLEADSTYTYSYKNALRMKKQECSINVFTGGYSAAGTDELSASTLPDNFPTSVTIKAGWAGPYALSGSENMTDNWGRPWDIYHYSTYDGSDALKWATPTTSEELDDNDYEDTNDEIVLGTEIYGIRSIYSEDYTSELSYKFPEGSAYADVTISLVDSAGDPINTATYTKIRVFLYLPYCAPKSLENGNSSDTEGNYPRPKAMELCVWADSSTENGLKIRYDADGDGSVLATETLRSSDAEFAYPSYLKTTFNEADTSLAQVALDGVPVGSRKIWAYAMDGSNNVIFAPLQNVKITATNNNIELRLSENF